MTTKEITWAFCANAMTREEFDELYDEIANESGVTATFKDAVTGDLITVKKPSETECWLALADKLGTMYVIENIRLVGLVNNKKEYTIEDMWDKLLELGVSEETLDVVTKINGFSEDTLEDILYATTGYRNFKQIED